MTPGRAHPDHRAAGPERYEQEDTTVVVYYRSHPAASIKDLHRRTGAEVDGLTIPQDVLNLRNVRPLPAPSPRSSCCSASPRSGTRW